MHRWPGNVKELQEVVRTALRLNDWDSALSLLNRRTTPMDNYSTVDLSPDGVALMPDFEIIQGGVLKRLVQWIPETGNEMGLMDLVWDEEAMNHQNIH